MNTDTHAAWVNARALEAGGITSSTPDPWDGCYVRDADGMPTGCLQEGAAYSFWSDVVPRASPEEDRKSTRLNSSHSQISYAVFCLKKKKKTRPVTSYGTHVHTPDSQPAPSR